MNARALRVAAAALVTVALAACSKPADKPAVVDSAANATPSETMMIDSAAKPDSTKPADSAVTVDTTKPATTPATDTATPVKK